MRLPIIFSLIILLTCTSFEVPELAPPPKAKINIAVFQRGVRIRPQIGGYRLFKEPFSIRLKVKNVEDVYLNTSVTSDLYDLGLVDEFPDLESLPSRSYAEYPENEPKKLFIDPEGFSYLGYSEDLSYHRYNLLYEKKKGFDGYRIVQRFHFTETEEVVEVADMDQDLYFFLIATQPGEDGATEEAFRWRFRVRWKD